jgi:hypothetical protein
LSIENDLRDRQVCDLTDEGLEPFLAEGFLVRVHRVGHAIGEGE